MPSEEALEIIEDRAEEHEQKAESLIQDRPRQAALLYLKAANSHERLADGEHSQSVGQAHHVKAKTLRNNAEQLLEQLGMVPADTDSSHDTASDETGTDSDSDRSESTDSSGRDRSTSSSQYFEDPPELDLNDVGGMTQLKEDLRKEVQEPLEHPEYYQKQAVGMENGVLFYGPPGTGKSHLAKSFAGELGFDYAEISAADITSKWVGEAPKAIQELFDEARSHEPCVLFIDEIDALASDRSDGNRKTNSGRQVVNELLTEMQEIQDSQILVIAATNKPGDLDSALTRTGRFNRKYHVGPPDANARKQILEVQLDEGEREVDWQSMDWQKLVNWSEGFSASDLEQVVKQAARESARQSRAQDRVVPVHYRHVLQTMKETEASLKHYNR
jgi:SpoVK/Ycf46/Vps4 family AAA+-type ATPase